MHFTYPLLYFLFLNVTTAHQISYSFRTQNRHVLEPMVKFVKDIQVNLDFITYKDPEIQREASDLLLYGADSLHQMIPSLSLDHANKLLQAVYARVVDQVENLALFSLANRLLEKESDKDTCPKTTTGDEHGMVMVDCPDPLCKTTNL
ncbi:uncharacterized protein EAE98_011234 [Botrytis deweyae]|uniref:Uncharacterized protein n=1 Tax=Botrytis deweyae TaxID=2478750 RepID=A0ABQ7I6P4_9HELO|nr:uncharacterized protein EAE98_011234 [Botrytis deweyae]KAF7915368.1 hypothetical protein EAE98_011234 [Botrytis deweyae]